MVSSLVPAGMILGGCEFIRSDDEVEKPEIEDTWKNDSTI
jgi:hypothetical protein